MKKLFISISILFNLSINAQDCLKQDWSQDYQETPISEFNYDGESDFVFFKQIIYQEAYAETNFFESQKKMGKNMIIQMDRAHADYNKFLRVELAFSFPYNYQLVDKYFVEDKIAEVRDDITDIGRYLIDYTEKSSKDEIINHGTVISFQGEYHIFDTVEKKRYLLLDYGGNISTNQLLTEVINSVALLAEGEDLGE